MPEFPDARLPFRAELAFGADVTAAPSTWTWADVSDRVLNQTVTITHGAQNESGGLNPSSISLDLDNPDGALTPDNPMSPHWPHVVQGTPFRYSLKGTETALVLDESRAGTATTPDHASFAVTDLDVRFEAEIDWYKADGNQTLIGQWGADGNRSWLLRVALGMIVLNWTTNGTVATVHFTQAPVPQLPRRAALRVTLDTDNGASGYTGSIYWAPTLDGPWTLIGTSTNGPTATTIFDGTAPLEIGPTQPGTNPLRAPYIGRGYRAEVRSGINGTVVAAPDFRALTEGATGFTDSTGKIWSVNGTAKVTAWRSRMVGNIGSWAPTWPYGDLSDGPTKPGESRVAITANGILRRMQQGKKQLASTLRRRIPSGSPLAYWPLEDGTTTTSAASGLPGGTPAAVTGVEWAAVDTLPGSSALPKLGNPASLRATVPAASTPGWHVECLYFLPSLPAAQTEILRVTVNGSVMRTAIVYASTANIRIEARDAGDDIIGFFQYTNATALTDFAGVWNRLQLFVSDDGGGTTRLVAGWRDITNGAGRWTSACDFAGTMGTVTQINGNWGAGTAGMVIGHLAAFAVPGTGNTAGVTIYDGADDGFTGERAGARLQRLAAEEGLPLQLLGPAAATASMGPQRPATLLDLLAECAATDGGILAEQRERSGLEYLPRTALYNRPVAWTLDAGANEITNPFAPVLDDQATRNDSQVSRPGGSSSVAADEASIAQAGLYDEQVTVNVFSDSQLAGIAQWRVHLGKWPRMRYPKISCELAVAPQHIDTWLRLGIGDRMQVINLPPQHPGTPDALVQGFAETISPTRWTVTATCSPAGPWTVAVLDDPERGRLDTSGCTLGGAVSASATTLTFVTAPGLRRWIDSAAFASSFPFNVLVGGEEVTVTAITGTTNTQTATVIRSVNGVVKGHAQGAMVSLAQPVPLAL
ncbi:hypothetical protein ABZ135_18395 [Streptomyces sp. NPDC006339]|uniref:hypothetical protein n=1 Tax=Streptomyces sp. NPDC006339 TaxID=3156755 RepID=UPI0033BACABA